MPETVKNLLQDNHTFATTLLAILLDTFGLEAVEWSPQTVVMEIRDEFGVNLPNVLLDRLMVAVELLTSNSFYKSLPDFIEFCNILSGNHSTLGQFAPADVADVGWGLTEAMLIMPPDEDDKQPFTPEIIGYIEETLKDEGILDPPDILKLGAGSSELLKKVQFDFSDDPEMFSSIWEFEKAKTDDINELIRERLLAMLMQIKSLPLKNPKAIGVITKMIGVLERQGQDTEKELI